MKILQINSVYRYGSTGKIAAGISSSITNTGNEAFIIYGRGKDSSVLEKNIYKIGSKFEQFRHLLLTRLLDRHGWGSKKSTMQMIQTIESINPDIIMLHNIHGYYVNIKTLFNYLSKKDIPIVWLFHDAWPISGHSAHFHLTNEGEIPTENNFFKQRFEYPASLFLNQSRKNFRDKKALFTSVENLTIVTPSEWLTERVKKSFFKPYKIRTIYNGIDTSLFKINNDAASHIREKFKNKTIVLGVSNVWTDKKGLRIFDKLASILPEDYQIIMIGVDKKTKAKLNKKIYTVQRTENIEELVAYYNAADVFVNPTYEDNFPTTNIESLACGTPVITFNTGGSPEALDDFSGIVTKEKSVKGVIDALETIKRKPFSEKNCRRRGKEFSIEDMFLQYQALFSNIIKGEKDEY